MDERVVKFLKRHRIAVLTTLVAGGQPHSASLHYAFNQNPFYLVFWTGSGTRKLNNMQENKSSKGSVVIGFSEEEWLTMQMEGEVKWITDANEQNEIWPCYAEKYDERKEYKDTQDSALLKFTPAWWRYSEVKPLPSIIISSPDKKYS